MCLHVYASYFLLSKLKNSKGKTMTISPDQIPQQWSSIASAYERAFEKLTRQFSQEAINRLDISSDDRVLDVATGTGSFSLAAAHTGAQVLATDFAPGMVERLEQRLREQQIHNVKTAVMDGQNLDIVDASFDVSASVVGVIFFPDIQKGLRELKRVLKPQGRCAVVCWNHPEHFEMMGYLQQAITLAVPDFEMPMQTPVWARMCGEQSLRENLLDAGFSRVDVSVKQGVLEIESVEQFWSDFTSSAPPLALLFEKLGEENSSRVGEKFIELVTKKAGRLSPKLSAQACIGIAYVN